MRDGVEKLRVFGFDSEDLKEPMGFGEKFVKKIHRRNRVPGSV